METPTQDQFLARNEAKSDQHHQLFERADNAELMAALEYRLGLNPDVYAISDVFEITAEAFRRRGLLLEATAGIRKNRILADLPATNGGASVPHHGRRRLDDALLLLALVVSSEHLIQDRDNNALPEAPLEGNTPAR